MNQPISLATPVDFLTIGADIFSVLTIITLLIAAYYVVWSLIEKYFLNELKNKAIAIDKKVLVDEKKNLS